MVMGRTVSLYSCLASPLRLRTPSQLPRTYWLYAARVLTAQKPQEGENTSYGFRKAARTQRPAGIPAGPRLTLLSAISFVPIGFAIDCPSGMTGSGGAL